MGDAHWFAEKSGTDVALSRPSIYPKDKWHRWDLPIEEEKKNFDNGDGDDKVDNDDNDCDENDKWQAEKVSNEALQPWTQVKGSTLSSHYDVDDVDDDNNNNDSDNDNDDDEDEDVICDQSQREPLQRQRKECKFFGQWSSRRYVWPGQKD